MNLEALALALVQAPSPSGDETPALLLAESALREAGLTVERQEVSSPARFNLFARHGRPRAVLTTHLDTVPGEIPVRVEGDVLHGRGACDAKGIAASMIAASALLRERRVSDFGVLLVVGEETTSDGAIAASAFVAAGGWGCRPEAALFGEPTGSAWVRSHPGVVMVSVSTRGEAGHSSQPRTGPSAIEALLDVLERVRRESWPETDMGRTLVNIGRIEGGTAFNVLAAAARADIMFRSGAPAGAILDRVRALADGAALDVSCAAEPARFRVPPGEDGLPVRFATDAPFLTALGEPWLWGPGAIAHAHAADERVALSDLRAAREAYAGWIAARVEAA